MDLAEFRRNACQSLRGLVITEGRFMILFHEAGKSFGNTVALRPTDLKIEANKTTVLIGLSGSGRWRPQTC